MLSERLVQVGRRWRQEGCRPVPPLPDLRLKERLIEVQGKPTQELVEVFSTLNGFDDGLMDEECLQFWTIDKIFEENSGSYSNQGSFCHFADFLINSHTYAFNQNEADLVSVHCHYGENHIIKIADSFDEFFEYYLTDTVKLFPE